MFGYVTPLTDELKVKEHLFYKSVYCGLCRCMGKRVCNESRVTLSYDIVFLALVRFALVGEKLEFSKGRCMASPLKQKVFLKSNPSLEYCSAAGALLAYHSLYDNVADTHGIKKVGAKIALSLSKRLRKNAALPLLDEMICGKLSELSEIEKSGEATLDSAAEKFGELLSEVFSFGLEGGNKRIASQLGYHIGKWIYTADAVDDFEDDKKENSFNPLDGIDKELLRCSMNLELEALSSAEALISYSDIGIKNIVENIIYLGLPSKMEKLLSKYPDKENNSLHTERKVENDRPV